MISGRVTQTLPPCGNAVSRIIGAKEITDGWCHGNSPRSTPTPTASTACLTERGGNGVAERLCPS
jgi:hypothetical protein